MNLAIPKPKKPSVAVLGAGLQGTCVALALARRGHSVTLIDQSPDLMLRASLRNEGKIHLGHVYAKDSSMRTARLMVRAAARFAPYIERFLGSALDWGRLRSRPFSYVIPNDTMVSPEDLTAYYSDLESLYTEENDGREDLHYAGQRLDRLFRPEPLHPLLNADRVQASIATPEVSIDMVALRELLRRAIQATPLVTTRFGRRVESIARASAGFVIEDRCRERGPWRQSWDLVVNCLWEGRLALDRQLGLEPKRSWVYRLKYRVLGSLPEQLRHLPSMTLVLGRYGDVVTYPHSDEVYLSWYPACLRGWSSDISTPAEWESACNGAPAPSDADVVWEETLRAFDALIPGMADCAVHTVDGGIIFSWGETDIDQPDSDLHRRDDIGVSHADGYFSINTGKLTCAPMFAAELLELL